jgi:proteasome lid subunit RPN8/RPN11
MFHVSEGLLNQIREHGEAHYPEEGAGFILGRISKNNRYAECILPVKNQFEMDSRHHRYLITPEDMIQTETKAEEIGLLILGVFHSHPDHPAIPSEFDRESALPWFSYMITTVHQDGAGESRSWRLSDDRQFVEEKIIIHAESKETQW